MANDHPPDESGFQLPSPTPQPPRSLWLRVKRRWWLYARWLIPGVLVLFFGLTTGISLYILAHSHTFTSSRVVERPGASRAFSWPLQLSRRVNILLIGIDVTLNDKRQVLPFARSDALILVSLDPERNQISALSIPRDTRAQIPGRGETKINAAYAYGGPRLTIKTVQQLLLGVPIHYYVKLGAESFARIIDAIGGVEIDVEKDMKYTDQWGDLYIDLKIGRQVLDGQRAMHYIQFRHDDFGDIGRIGRQQKMLMALFQKVKSPATVLHAPQLLRAFAENTQTNLSMKEMITLGTFGLRLSSTDIHTAMLPGRISPEYWEPDLPKIPQLVAELFYGVDQQMLASTAIEVINSSGVPGLARKTAQQLERLGFRIVRIDSAPTISAVTTIIDRSGRPHVARLLADILGHSRIKHEPGRGPDITVLLARDQARRQVSLVVTAQP